VRSGASSRALASRLGSTPTRELFARDAQRFAHFSLQAAGFVFDYCRQRIDAGVLDALIALADQLDLRARIEAMFTGQLINTTEGRAVLHTALRRSGQTPLMVEGTDVNALVLRERERVLSFAEDVRQGRIRSSTEQPFTLVVNIGIGGSDLVPRWRSRRSEPYTHGAPQVAFVSNVDGCGLSDLLESADPARTLFIICSKTFTTLETLDQCARGARAGSSSGWARRPCRDISLPSRSTRRAMDEFGVHPDYRFAMWDWVGGRYSVWSAIGVSLAIAIGRSGFESLSGGCPRDR
jgi:glucose-6-phosphate isomerase